MSEGRTQGELYGQEYMARLQAATFEYNRRPEVRERREREKRAREAAKAARAAAEEEARKAELDARRQRFEESRANQPEWMRRDWEERLGPDKAPESPASEPDPRPRRSKSPASE